MKSMTAYCENMLLLCLFNVTANSTSILVIAKCSQTYCPMLGACSHCCWHQRPSCCCCCCMCVGLQHRYYGKTQPFGDDSWRVDPSFLTAEQAMSDYATLLHNLTHTWRAADRCGGQACSVHADKRITRLLYTSNACGMACTTSLRTGC
jgi:hypothetical protein